MIKCCWRGGPKGIFKNMIKIRIKPMTAGDLARLQYPLKLNGLLWSWWNWVGCFYWLNNLSVLYRGNSMDIPWLPRMSLDWWPWPSALTSNVCSKYNHFLVQMLLLRCTWTELGYGTFCVFDLSTGLLLQVRWMTGNMHTMALVA